MKVPVTGTFTFLIKDLLLKPQSVVQICWIIFFSSCIGKKNDLKPTPVALQLSQVSIGNQIVKFDNSSVNTVIDQPIIIDFSNAVDTSTVSASIALQHKDSVVDSKITFQNNYKTISISPRQHLQNNKAYKLTINTGLKGKQGEIFAGVSVSFTTIPALLVITSFKIDTSQVAIQNGQITNISLNPVIDITFSASLNLQTAISSNFFLIGTNSYPLQITISNQNKTATIISPNQLNNLTKFTFGISSSIQGANSEIFNGYSKTFYTQADAAPKFPIISDSSLLDLVQRQTLKYFYDFGEPNSGMARERNTSGNTVTTGGSGFGIMAMIAGIKRGFISRGDGIARFNKIVSYLERADRFHGAWPHWSNGATGKVIPFGPNDDGADLVETSFMLQGLLTLRQFLSSTDTLGNNMINRINKLWYAVEFDWFRQNNQEVLYWHWSPNKGWIMNMPINGYDEALIVYILAAASPTHTISADVYQKGWALNGGIANGKTFYNHVLPVGQDYGGPLFFAHYSFLGFDPHTSDAYANYWDQNTNHTLINHDYCVANPKHYVGYSDQCWGLTASDIQSGYDAQSPTNDNGTISPTAAISSMPYTPTQSMNAIKYFYYTLGDRLWGQYGFYDAFNITNGWAANSTLAIDQGPIVVMIENYRSQLLWKLFMSSPEIQLAKTKLGFN